MNRMLVALILFLVMASSGLAASFDVVSDAATKYFDGSVWQDSVAAWVHGSWPSIPGATWIWTGYQVTPQEAANGAVIDFRRTFDIPACEPDFSQAIKGSIQITADNNYTLSVNSNFVGNGTLANIVTYDISSKLVSGSNTLDFHATNWPWGTVDPEVNPGGLLYKASIEYTCESQIPEFGTIAAMVALAGAVTAFFVIRKQ
jgi:hypothetical protein